MHFLLQLLFSHLVALDVARKENIKSNGNIDTPNIEFSIAYGLNGRRVEEYMSVPLGMGHFETGINHLRENFGVDLESKVAQKEKEHTDTRLDKFCIFWCSCAISDTFRQRISNVKNSIYQYYKCSWN